MIAHFHNSECLEGCVGNEEHLQWAYYPYGQYPSDGGLWKLERVWVAHANVDGNRETYEFRAPVIVEIEL